MLRDSLVKVIRFYQRSISPYLPASCRYQPSCSEYAMEAIKTHGTLIGVWLGIKRIARCHPFGGWGYDPVPSKQEKDQQSKDLR